MTPFALPLLNEPPTCSRLSSHMCTIHLVLCSKVPTDGQWKFKSQDNTDQTVSHTTYISVSMFFLSSLSPISAGFQWFTWKSFWSCILNDIVNIISSGEWASWDNRDSIRPSFTAHSQPFTVVDWMQQLIILIWNHVPTTAVVFYYSILMGVDSSVQSPKNMLGQVIEEKQCYINNKKF